MSPTPPRSGSRRASTSSSATRGCTTPATACSSARPSPNISRDILIEGNAIYDNGIVGSLFEHNAYTEALGITYQYNYFGPTKAGAGGNNLKDRSAGLVVRQNWIEGGNRQLDLVETDSLTIQNSAAYRTTFVYGNVLVETDGSGNRQIAHYGGDNGTTSKYRKGTLYFYNNTMVSYRTDRTTLFRLSTNEERADVRNNIFYVTAAGTTLSLRGRHWRAEPDAQLVQAGPRRDLRHAGGHDQRRRHVDRRQLARLPRRSRTGLPPRGRVGGGQRRDRACAGVAAGAGDRAAIREASEQRGASQRRRVRPRRVRADRRPAAEPGDLDQQPPGRHRRHRVRRVRVGDRRPGAVCLDDRVGLASRRAVAQPAPAARSRARRPRPDRPRSRSR